MAIPDWELNLFRSDPSLLARADETDYVEAAAALRTLADPKRLMLLHALSVGEDTVQRAALWSRSPQSEVERELEAMIGQGLVSRVQGSGGTRYVPRDGHLVVELHVALAHGREPPFARHPRLLARRRRRAGAA